MKTNKIYLITALLGAVLFGCQKVDEPVQRSEEKPSSGQGWTLTVQATKTADTKALELSGSALNAYWKKGEKVSVYLGGTLLGTLTVTSEDKATPATLSGTISAGGLTVGNSLTLLFPGRNDGLWTYLGQTGSGPDETGSMFDYSMASLTVSALDEANKTITVSTAANFVNQQSIYRLGFKVGGTNIPVKSISFISNQNKLVRTRTFNENAWVSEYGTLSMETANTADNLYWMSIRNENTNNNDTYTFSVVGNDNALYEGTKTIDAQYLKYGQFLGVKGIAVQQKVLSKSSGSIDNELKVL